MKPLLHLQDLEKSFGRQMVLDHVGFELQSGEIIGDKNHARNGKGG